MPIIRTKNQFFEPDQNVFVNDTRAHFQVQLYPTVGILKSLKLTYQNQANTLYKKTMCYDTFTIMDLK